MKKLPGNVLYLGLVSFFTDFSTEMIYPLIPAFLTSVLGVGAGVLGMIEGVAEATASILKALSGTLSDRFSRRKPLVVAGYTLSALAKPFIGVASSWHHVLVARFVDRMGKGIRTSPRDALISESTSPEERGKAFGFHRSMDTLGAVAGPLTAFILLSFLVPAFGTETAYRSIFLISIIPGLTAVFILFKVKETSSVKVRRKGNFLKNYSLLPRSFWIFLLIMVVFSLGNSSDTFILLMVKERGIPVKSIMLLYMIFNMVYSAVSTPAGIVSDRIGRKNTLLIAFLIYGLTYFAITGMESFLNVAVIFVLYGIFYGFYEGSSRAFVTDLVEDPALRGTAYGVYHMAVGLTLLPANFVAGFLWKAFSPEATFYFGGILAILSFILLLGGGPWIRQKRS